MCASTGGPQALAAVLAAIPSGYPLPILVVQHIAAGFTEGLARWLDGAIPLPVRLAEHGLPALPGVTVAPEGAHLVFGPTARSRSTIARRPASTGPRRTCCSRASHRLREATGSAWS